MAVTATQARPVVVPLRGSLPGTFCGPFRPVPSPHGPAAGQAGEQTAPSLPRHTRGNQGKPGYLPVWPGKPPPGEAAAQVYGPGRSADRAAGRHRGRGAGHPHPRHRRRARPAQTDIPGERAHTHEHQEGKEHSSSRPLRLPHHNGNERSADRRAHHTPLRPQFGAADLGTRSQGVGGGAGCHVAAIDRAAGGCGGQAGSASRRQRQPEAGRVNMPTRS